MAAAFRAGGRPRVGSPAEQHNLKRGPAQRQRIEALHVEYHEIAASERSVSLGD